MKNFRTLHLAVAFYKQARCQKLSSNLRAQLERAASSIALNLAEGRGRKTRNDQLKFFNIALASLRECQIIFELADLRESALAKEGDILGAHLYRLIQNAR